MNKESTKVLPLVLIVEDNIESVQVIINFLKIDKYQIAVSTSAEDALNKLTTVKIIPDIILLDLGLPGMSGEEFLRIVKEKLPLTPIVITTGSNNPEIIVRCMKAGAIDFIVKPLDKIRTITSIKNALNLQESEKEVQGLKNKLLHDDLKYPEAFSLIITKNPQMISMFKYIEVISRTCQPVLVTGETGTGKELFANALHLASGRTGRFIPVNTAGLDDHMFSDTLFGHEKGAFTGATSDRKGLIEESSDGTIFLDEIGDITKSSQVKLLRLLQEKEYMPLGSDKYKCSKARVVLATNQNLDELVQKNEFRIDLFYRIKSHCLYIPPLRERKDDIPLLLDSFIMNASKELSIKPPFYKEEILDLLRSYNFPGNVRELRGMVYEAVVKNNGEYLSPNSFSINIETNNKGKKLEKHSSVSMNDYFRTCFTLPTINQVTEILIKEALVRSNNNKTLASNLIDMNRGTLRNRLEEYGS